MISREWEDGYRAGQCSAAKLAEMVLEMRPRIPCVEEIETLSEFLLEAAARSHTRRRRHHQVRTPHSDVVLAVVEVMVQ